MRLTRSKARRGQLWNIVGAAHDTEVERIEPSPTGRGRSGGIQGLIRAITGKDHQRESVARKGQSRLKATLVARHGAKCENCDTAMPSSNSLHLHHVVPVSRGGLTTEENVALVCPNCHAKAHWLDRQLGADKRPTDRDELLAALDSAA